MLTDFIIIGSGIGGLCCGALLARYGFRMSVCESHSIAGGAAHGFERQGFKFDSGPSLYSGLSYNPRRHQGSYGSAIAAGKGFFPGTKTPVEGLWCCRDSTFLA